MTHAEIASRCPLTTATVGKIATHLKGLTHAESLRLIELARLGLSERGLIERLEQDRTKHG
ncbi:hypothetical protein [Deinococcus sp. QL22]|uniref:hypothetical protein n=1 Tax=Deinococcus sp. QL22 TaxID=2939437 RepID=UPI002016AB9B|nr:hypothetical protein [Deinococcus sp. QL22]UQN10380.1 hypothetical protein M1R55_29960 [Deinococcus sp. QL22]UQN10514.1 hypothetical protein M1R55_29285 [Deinococcus sp. QL22]